MLDLTPYQGLLIDLDGVLYVDQQPLEGAIETVRALSERGRLKLGMVYQWPWATCSPAASW